MLWRTETPDLDANDITRRCLLVEISLPSLNDYLRATFFTNSIIIINITLKSLADFERQPRIEDALSNCPTAASVKYLSWDSTFIIVHNYYIIM